VHEINIFSLFKLNVRAHYKKEGMENEKTWIGIGKVIQPLLSSQHLVVKIIVQIQKEKHGIKYSTINTKC
jgi:hypothetical protein